MTKIELVSETLTDALDELLNRCDTDAIWGFSQLKILIKKRIDEGGQIYFDTNITYVENDV